MAFTKTDEELIQRTVGEFCNKRTPKNSNLLWYEYKIDKQDVIIVEKRPYWNQNDPVRKDIITGLDVAKIKYIRSDGKWVLYWKRANEKWLQYEMAKQTKKLQDILKEIEKDSHGCFFG